MVTLVYYIYIWDTQEKVTLYSFKGSVSNLIYAFRVYISKTFFLNQSCLYKNKGNILF